MQEQKLKGKIGLEIHVYLVTKEKLFCRCRNSREKGLKANVNICPICTGMPGAKPMLPNKSAVEKAVQVALMLNCKVNESLVWQRKHYSWPDLPKGYQNTISGGESIGIGVKGNFHGIGIWSIHLEEDPAAWDPSSGKVDYNRSGVPLIEIITAPEFDESEQVVSWLRKLLHNLEYLKAVHKDGGIKVDVNVNIPGKTERVEIKNVNSIENIGMAIEYELERQGREGSEVRETRRFDALRGVTMKMREKEGEADYRFISDPDLLNIEIDKNFVSLQKSKVPESPQVKLEKLVKKYKIGKEDASVLAKNLEVVEFFESVSELIDGKFALHWITGGLLGMLNYNKVSLGEINVDVEHFVELLNEIKRGKITELQGKEILNKFYPNSFSLKEKGVEEKITDGGELEKICKEVLKREESVVMRYRAGEKVLLNYLIGQVMKKSEKRADFRKAKEILERLLR